MADEIKWKTILEAAEHNDMEAIKYFVENKHVDMTTCNSDEQTAAHIALKNGHFQLLKYLVIKQPSIMTATDSKSRNILIQAVDQGALDVIKFLVGERGEDLGQAHNLYYGNTAVHMAALRGKMDILKYFLEDLDIDVNIRSDFEETPLFLAAERVNMQIVKYLVGERKAKTTLTDKNYDNVLFISARKGDLTVPKYILDEIKSNIDLNHRDFFGETVLHRAVKFQHFPFIEYMIDEKGVNVNLPDDEGNTPLHVAADKGFLNIVEFLCDSGAFMDVKNEMNQTAVDIAKDPQVQSYLKEAATDPPDTRRRRSVASHVKMEDAILPSNRHRHCSEFGDRSCGWGMQIVEKVQFWSTSIGQIGSSSVSADYPLNGVLIFIGACLKFPSLWGYVKTLSSSFSREDILRSRMDSVAVDAVRNGLNSF